MRSRTVGGVVTLVAGVGTAAVVLILALSGDGSVANADDAPSIVTVSCAPSGISVSDDTVTATAPGVRLTVSSTMPSEAYLTVSSPDGFGGGDPLPKTPETRIFSVAPGTFSVACQPRGADPGSSDVAELTVADPDHYWRATTLADLGCLGSSEPFLGSASGTTARAAVDALLTTFC
ncbi:hypothetical protein ABLE68_14975 [Nocardioides sp. CN2-186]|uniref:hypothetical protein n=1 Tax=Nocardioides tweenelious TaxID=3156607 RepID=UPI0032B5D4A0